MSLTIMLVGLLPIFLFVILDLYATPKVAIYAAVLCAVGLGAFYYFALGEWDHSISAEIALFIVFGAIALRMNNPRLFKFQPVVVGVLLAAFLTWHEIFVGPYFLKAAALMGKLAPEYESQMANPKMHALMSKYSVHCIYILVFHAAVMAWVAAKKSNWAWALWRAAIWPLLGLAVLVDAIGLAS